MKNLYIYGRSDDCHEVESDFGLRDEFYSDADLNSLTIHWEYNGDWKITLSRVVPEGWSVHTIDGTSQVVHIQIPDGDKVMLRQSAGDMDEDDRPGYLMDYIESWCKDQGISSIDRFHEMYQIDGFQQEVEDFAEEVIKMANRYAKEIEE